MKTPKKIEVISVRVEKKVKDKLTEMAHGKRRDLSDYVRLILTDIAEGIIKINI